MNERLFLTGLKIILQSQFSFSGVSQHSMGMQSVNILGNLDLGGGLGTVGCRNDCQSPAVHWRFILIKLIRLHSTSQHYLSWQCFTTVSILYEPLNSVSYLRKLGCVIFSLSLSRLL